MTDHERDIRFLTYQRDAMQAFLERLDRGEWPPHPQRNIRTLLTRVHDWENRRHGGSEAPGEGQ